MRGVRAREYIYIYIYIYIYMCVCAPLVLDFVFSFDLPRTRRVHFLNDAFIPEIPLYILEGNKKYDLTGALHFPGEFREAFHNRSLFVM